MRRREFITLLGAAMAVWPLAARAQQERKLATIGLLGSGTAAAQSQWTAAFVRRMRELGWIEGRNLTIEYRWAEGHDERLRELWARPQRPTRARARGACFFLMGGRQCGAMRWLLSGTTMSRYPR